MAGAAPKTVIDELSEEITRFGDEQKRVGYINELGWKRLLNKIKALAKNVEFSAPSLLMQATMHGIRGDAIQANEVLDQHSVHYGKTMHWYIIRASLVRIFGDPLLIVDMLESAYPHGDLSNLQSVLSACNDSGFYSSAKKILLEIEKINPALAQQLDRIMPGILPAARYIEDFDLDEVRISERVLMLTKLVIESGYMLRILRVLTTEVGIIYEVIVDDEIEKLAQLNLRLYERLSNNFDFSYSEHISVGVSPMENRYGSK